MQIYFFDENNRYIGNRKLEVEEVIPTNATTEVAEIGDGQEAYLVDGKWVVSDIVSEQP
jgi:hypothetical protein